MSVQRVVLSGTEAAFVDMVLEEHKARFALADRRRDERMAVLLREKGIPEGVQVQRATEGDAVVLTYEVAEMAVAE